MRSLPFLSLCCVSNHPRSRFQATWKLIVSCAAVLMAFASRTQFGAADDGLVPLPVIGAELIDGGLMIGSPPGDYDPGQGTGRELQANSTEIAIDYLGRSVVADFGQLQRIQRVEVCSTYDTNGVIQNLNESTLELYHSVDNIVFEKVTGYRYQSRAGAADDFVDIPGSAQKKLKIHNIIELSGLDLYARYLKVHSLYQGRNYDFVGSPDRLIRAFGRPGAATVNRVRLNWGMLHNGANVIGVNVQHFEDLSSLNCRVRLFPLGTGEAIINTNIKIPLETNASDGWVELNIDLPRCESGLYRLVIERIDESKDLTLWSDEQEIRVVRSLVLLESFDQIELIPPVQSGDCLLILPGDAAGTWQRDVTNPEFPLWRGIGTFTIPVSLRGSFAFYVGILGHEKGFSANVGTEQLTPVSSPRHPSAIRDVYFGVADNVDTPNFTLGVEDQETPHAIAWIKLLALTPRQIRLARGEEDLSHDRKIIYVSDGASWFGEFDHKPVRRVEDIEAKANLFKDANGLVERFDWCPGSSTVIWGYPTRIGELIGKRPNYPRNIDRYITENILDLIERGHPPLEVIADASHRNGLKTYAAIRMASYHTPPYADFYNSDFWREHPEYRILYYDGRPNECLSYAFPEVRQLYLNQMREMLDFGIDGIHCEFLRDSTLVGFEKPVVESYEEKYHESPFDPSFENWERWHRHRAEIMTDFVRSVRTMLDEEGLRRNKQFGLSARIPCYDYLKAGLDPKAWMDQSLVDIVAVGTNQLPNHPMPLQPFIEMSTGTDCKIYSSFEDAMGDGRDPEPSDDEAGVDPGWHSHASADDSRDFVIRELRKGALGVYRFNSEGNDWRLYQHLERWDEFENPRRLLKVNYETLGGR